MQIKINRILIIEDNENFRKSLKNILSSRFGSIKFEEATDSRTTLNKIKKSMPDAILMDITLQEKNGFSLIEKIRKIHPDAFIISMAYENSDEYEKAARKHGADYHLSKINLNLDYISELLESIIPAPRGSHTGNRRKHVRYKAKDLIFVNLRSETGERFGQLLDISEGGLSHCYYVARKEQEKYAELGIFPVDSEFTVENIRFRKVRDTGFNGGSNGHKKSLRRQGVQFENLMPEQKTKLDHFLANCTSGRA